MNQQATAAIIYVAGLLAMLGSTFMVAYEGSLLWGVFVVFIAGFISLVITLTLFIIAMVLFSRAVKYSNDRYNRRAWILIFLSIPTNILITLFNIYAYLNPVHFPFG